MPLYQVDVDGQTVEFDSPVDLTPEQLEAEVSGFRSQIAPPAAPEEAPGYISQLGTSLYQSGRQALGGARTAFNALTGDTADMAAGLQQQAEAQRALQEAQTPEDVAFLEDLNKQAEELKQARGFLPTLSEAIDLPMAALRQPGAAIKTAVQSLPNALISTPITLGAGLVGTAAGGLVGLPTTGPGAVATGIAGGIAAGTAANTALEAGSEIYQRFVERIGDPAGMTREQIAAALDQNPDIASEGLTTGLTRGAVIGTIETLGLKGAGALLAAPERAAIQATRQVLTRSGVDLADDAAVRAAMATPEMAKATKAAADAARAGFNVPARAVGAGAVEIGASGVGEALAQQAVGQETDYADVFLEMLGEGVAAAPSVLAARGVELAGTGIQAVRERVSEQVADNAKADARLDIDDLINNAGENAAIQVNQAVDDAAKVVPAGQPADRAAQIKARLAEIEAQFGPPDQTTFDAQGNPVTTPYRVMTTEESRLRQEIADLGAVAPALVPAPAPAAAQQQAPAPVKSEAVTVTASGKKVGDKVDPGENLSAPIEEDLSSPNMPVEYTVVEVSRIIDPAKNEVEVRRRDMTPAEIAEAQQKIRQRNEVAAEMGLAQSPIPEAPASVSEPTPITPQSLPTGQAQAPALGAEATQTQPRDEIQIAEAGGLPPVESQPVVQAPAVEAPEGAALGGREGQEGQVTPEPVQPVEVALDLNERFRQAEDLGIDYPDDSRLPQNSEDALGRHWEKFTGSRTATASKEQLAAMEATPYARGEEFGLPVYVGSGSKNKPPSAIYEEYGSIHRRFPFKGTYVSLMIGKDNDIHFSVGGSLGATGFGAFETMNAIAPYLKQLLQIHSAAKPGQTYSFHANDKKKTSLFKRYVKRFGLEQVGDFNFRIPAAAAPQPLPPTGGVPTESLPAGQPTSGDVGTALRAVATNTATPEQVQMLKELRSEVFNSPLPKEDPGRAAQDQLLRELNAAVTQVRRAASANVKAGDRLKSKTGKVVEVAEVDPESGLVRIQGAIIGRVDLSDGDLVPTQDPLTVRKAAVPVSQKPATDLTADEVRSLLYSDKTTADRLVVGDSVWSVSKGVGQVTKKLKTRVDVRYSNGETERVAEAYRLPDNAAQWLQNRQDLSAVATNTATPEQVASLEAQGLARTVQGQPVITDAGLAQMPEAERPRLTEAERVAEIEGQGGIVASLRDMDVEYMDAVARGDMETAQRLVDQMARRSGKLFGKWFHGSPSGVRFEVFDPTKGRSFGRWNAIGSWFTLDRKAAAGWAENYQRSTEGRLVPNAGTVYDSYLFINNPLSLDGYDALLDLWTETTGVDTAKATLSDVEKFKSAVRERGYDGLVVSNVEGDSPQNADPSQTYAIAFDPNQIKSADPVTYDDNGNVIPLSQRFQPESPDIRFSVRNTPPANVQPSTRPLQGDQQRNETSARRRRGKAQVPASLRDRDGPPLPNIKVNANDGARAREIEDKQVPGAKDTWIGTAAEYLAEFPDQTAVNDRRVEAFYDAATDRAVILIDRVVARDGDAIRAARNGTSAAVEAVRRLIRHESFVHRGWRALPQNLKTEFLGIAESLVPEEEIEAIVAKGYSRYAGWRTDPAVRALVVEEWLAQRLETLEKLPATDGGPLSRLIDWAKRVWQWLNGNDAVEPTRAELVDVMRQMIRALEIGEKSREVAEPIRPSFIGEKAQMSQFMRDSLETARSMAAAGKSSEEIRAVTGWFPGLYDGKMRWELPDEGAEMTRRLPKIGSKLRLDEVIKHPALFDAYPELRGMEVWGRELKNAIASFNTQGYISIDPRSGDFMFGGGLGTILHEIQHAIQKKEGFARGGSPSEFESEKKSLEKLEKMRKSVADARSLLRSAEFAYGGDIDAAARFLAGPPYKQKFSKATISLAKRSTRKDLDDLDADLLRQKLAGTKNEPNEKYKRLAGEIEARDVQARRTMTPEQRAATAPYSSENIAPEDAIVIFDGREQGVMASLTDTDAAYMDALQGDSGNDNLTEQLRAATEADRQGVLNDWIARNPQSSATLQQRVNEAAKEAGKIKFLRRFVDPSDIISRSGHRKTWSNVASRIFGERIHPSEIPVIVGRYIKNSDFPESLRDILIVAETSRKLSREEDMAGNNILDIITSEYETGEIDPVTGINSATFDLEMAFRNSLRSANLKRAEALSRIKDKTKNLYEDREIINLASSLPTTSDIEAEDSSIVFRNKDSAPFEPSDPVTYDDAGNVIPPSQRFQPESPDIRFSLTDPTASNIIQDANQTTNEQQPTRSRPLSPETAPGRATEMLPTGEEVVERTQIDKTSMPRLEALAIKFVDSLGPVDTWPNKILNTAWWRANGGNMRDEFGRMVMAEALYRTGIGALQGNPTLVEVNDLISREYQIGATSAAKALATQSYVTTSERYGPMFAVQGMVDQRRRQQETVIDANVDVAAGVDAVNNADAQAQSDASAELDEELRLKDAIYELGLAARTPEIQTRIRRINDNVFRLGVLAQIREQLLSRVQASFVGLSRAAVEQQYASLSVEQIDAEIARLEREVADDVAAVESERQRVRAAPKPKGAAADPITQARTIITRLEADPKTKKTPKANPVRDLYREHLKNPMAEDEFMTRMAGIGVPAAEAQKLYGLAAVKIAATEAVKAQREAESKEDSPAVAFAKRTIDDVASRLADPALPQEERQRKVLAIRELYKEHVRDGLPFDVFISRAEAAGVEGAMASTLHGVGMMEREARETTRGYNEAQAGQRFAEKTINDAATLYADPALPQPVRNKRRVAAQELYNKHVKKAMDQAEFLEAARKAGVNEATAMVLFNVGNMTREAREAQAYGRRLIERRERLLDAEGSALENLINKLRGKITGDLSWREMFDRPLETQRQWRRDLFAALRNDPALAGLTPQEIGDLVVEIDKVWEAKRKKNFEAQLKRMNLPGAKGSSKDKIAKSAPKLLRYINAGFFNDAAFRNAISEEFGIPALNEETVKQVVDLMQRAQADGITEVERKGLMLEAIRLMQRDLKAELGDILSNYWVTSVLSGFATQFDMAFSALNGMRVMAQSMADLAIRKREFKLAGRAGMAYLRALGNAILEAARYFYTGDPKLLDNYQYTLNTYLTEGSAAANPFDYFERIIKDPNRPSWKKIMPYFYAGMQRAMTAFDHINSTATTQGMLEMAMFYNRELYEGARMPSKEDVAAARAKAVEMAGGDKTWGQKREVSSYTRQILNELLNKKYPGLLDEARDIGKVVSYTNDPTGIGGIVYHTLLGVTNKYINEAGKYRDEVRAQQEAASRTKRFMANLNYIAATNARNPTGLRFIRFVGNRLNEILSFTPGFGLFRLQEKGMTPTMRAMIIQNQTLGFSLSVLAGVTILRALTDEEDDEKRGFRISGSWSSLPPDKKNQLRASDRTPYSIEMWNGKRWIGFNYNAWPIASIIATVGNLNDQRLFNPEKWEEKDFEDKLLSAAWAGAFSFKDLSALSGFMDMIGKSAYSTDPVEGATQWIAKFSTNYIGGFVPRMLKDIDLIMDPETRKARDFGAYFVKELPFFRRTEAAGEKLYNIFGEPVKLNRMPWRRAVTATREEPEYETLAELNRRGIFLGAANPSNRTVGSGATRRELTDAEAEKYMVETGKLYRDFIKQQGQSLLQLDRAQAEEVISKTTERLRAAALRMSIGATK